MRVWIVEAEHPSTPGIVQRVCQSPEAAAREALALTNLIRQGLGMAVVEDGWEDAIEAAQIDYEGDADFGVWINEAEVVA